MFRLKKLKTTAITRKKKTREEKILESLDAKKIIKEIQRNYDRGIF